MGECEIGHVRSSGDRPGTCRRPRPVPGPPSHEGGPTPTLASLQTSDAPCVLADHKGVVLAINPAFEQVYGWCEAELVGTPSDQSSPHG
jgi:hypothetical protein